MISLDLPSKSDIARLSRQAAVAIAVRYSSYVMAAGHRFIETDFSIEQAKTVEQTLEYAKKFADEGIENQRDVRQIVEMAQIAKVAQEENEAARNRGDYVRDFETEAAFCAIWTIEWTARIAQKGTTDYVDLTYDIMVYAAKAVSSLMIAQKFVTGASQENITAEGKYLAVVISDAFTADFDVVCRTESSQYPQTLFGPLRIDQDKPSIDSERWHDVPVFMSSTFADMQVERDYLRDVVFLQLEAALRDLKIRPIPVDLRWGIDVTSVENDRLERKILDVCLDEIDRCHPYFIALLGHRYGWIPPDKLVDPTINSSEALTPEHRLSVTAYEINYAISKSADVFFYLRDELPLTKMTRDVQRIFQPLDDEEYVMSLRSGIMRMNPDRTRHYSVKWNEASQSYNGLRSFGEVVFQDLYQALQYAREHIPPSTSPKELSYNGHDPESYCEEIAKRYHKTLSGDTIAVLAQKSGQATSPIWLDTALDLLLRLDEHDFKQLKLRPDNPVQALPKFINEFANQLPIDLVELYQFVLDRIFKQLDVKFAANVLLLIGVSRAGLREFDLGGAYHKLVGKSWNPLGFANLRRYLKRHLIILDDKWQFASQEFGDAVQNKFGTDKRRQLTHLALGEYFMTLPKSNPIHVSEIIFHLLRGDEKKQVALLLSAFNSKPNILGSSNSLVEQAISSLVMEIIASDDQIPNPLVCWVSELIATEDLKHTDRHRLCERIGLILPKYLHGKVSVADIATILASCHDSLSELENSVQDITHRPQIIAFGVDDDHVDMVRNLGAATMEDLEEQGLDKHKVRSTLKSVCVQLGLMYENLGHYDRAIECYKQAKTIIMLSSKHITNIDDLAGELSQLNSKVTQLEQLTHRNVWQKLVAKLTKMMVR